MHMYVSALFNDIAFQIFNQIKIIAGTTHSPCHTSDLTTEMRGQVLKGEVFTVYRGILGYFSNIMHIRGQRVDPYGQSSVMDLNQSL